MVLFSTVVFLLSSMVLVHRQTLNLRSSQVCRHSYVIHHIKVVYASNAFLILIEFQI